MQRCLLVAGHIAAFSQQSRSSLSMSSYRPSVGIIGGGLAGLSTAYHLAKSGRVASVTIYDAAEGPGIGGASAVAAGLMHPFTPRARFIYKGLEGFAVTKEMLEASSSASPSSSQELYTTAPILRPCLDAEEMQTWSEGCRKQPDWLLMETPEKCYRDRLGLDTNPFVGALGVVLMRQTITIDMRAYLRGLWLATKAAHAASGGEKCEWLQEEVTSLSDISSRHDATVLSAGLGTSSVWTASSVASKSSPHNLMLKYVRGQNLVYPYSLSNALLAGEYVVPLSGGSRVLAGATHEYASTEELIASQTSPDAPAALKMIGEKLFALLPALRDLQPLSATCGVRVVAPRTNLGKLPVIACHDSLPNVFLLTGLGSRGVIHAGLMGRYLAMAIVDRDVSGIPSELLVR